MSSRTNRSMHNMKASWLSRPLSVICGLALVLALFTVPAAAQNFMVQCPSSTLWHPTAPSSIQGEPAYTGPALYSPPPTLTNGVPLTYVNNGGAVKCQQISGGDGYMSEADGNQTFMFAFGPLSGLDKIKNGQAGTDYPDEFNQPYCDPSGTIANYNNGQPIPYSPGGPNPLSPKNTLTCGLNGAVGYLPPDGYRPAAGQVILLGNGLTSPAPTGVEAVIVSDIANFPNATPGAGYASPPLVTFGPPDCSPVGSVINGVTCTHVQATGIAAMGSGSVIEVGITNPGNGYLNAPSVTFTPTSAASTIARTDPAAIMNTGVMNGNIPAPEMAFDEDDEFFLTLTNVGMIMRPDLFEQHTVHFHGYPNASSFYDGVPDASLAINIGASFTYYYLAPDAGTYFWHCHITPPEHLQMGMVGQLYVRPRQNRVPVGTNLYYAMTGTGTLASHGTFGTATGLSQQSDLRTACVSNGQSNLYNGTAGTIPSADILCSVPSPAANNNVTHVAGYKYVYNDGDGSTRYDVDVPMQMHGFDPNFHFVGMTFNPEGFADMKDKYFLLNGRSYPDTVDVATSSVNPAAGWTGGLADGTANPDVGATGGYGTNSITTQGSDGQSRPEQPISTLVILSQTGAADHGPQRAALRLVNLSVSEYHTLASLNIPLHVIGWNAKMLRDQAGNNMDYFTNSITIGGGESMDALLDACAVRGPAPNYTCTTPVPVGTYFVYSPNLDHLSNDAENFGGLMTEVVVTP
jgi:hypothetical protein